MDQALKMKGFGSAFLPESSVLGLEEEEEEEMEGEEEDPPQHLLQTSRTSLSEEPENRALAQLGRDMTIESEKRRVLGLHPQVGSRRRTAGGPDEAHLEAVADFDVLIGVLTSFVGWWARVVES